MKESKRERKKQIKLAMERIRWMNGYVVKYRGAMVFYTLLGLVGTVVSLASSMVSKDLVDIITGHETGAVVHTFLFMICFNLGTVVFGQISSYFSESIRMKVDTQVKADIFSKILVTDWEALSGYHTGDLMTRWSADASNISAAVLSFVPNLVINVFRFTCALGIILYYDASFVIFAFLGVPLTMLLSGTLLKRMLNNEKESAMLSARMMGFQQEVFSNIQTIKAFDLIQFHIEQLKTLQQEFIRMKLRYRKLSVSSSFLLAAVGVLVSYASYGWGIYRVWSDVISFGTMTMFLSLAGTLTGTVNSLGNMVPSLIGLTTSAGRLMDILAMPREDYSQEAEAEAFLERNKESGIRLSVEDISYAYQGGEPVFEHASLEVQPNEVVALVGPSGEGKTTMLRILLSLILKKAGTAFAVGKDRDILELSPSTRRLFSYVPQGNTMFSGTIAENMRSVHPSATEEEMIEALKTACAWEFVSKLPDGIHSRVKERGGGLSEGQAQRLSIARALLRDAPILLLDEASSALDIETEQRLLHNIMNAKTPRSCIIATHRTAALSACSKVYVIRERQCVALSQEEITKRIQQDSGNKRVPF